MKRKEKPEKIIKTDKAKEGFKEKTAALGRILKAKQTGEGESDSFKKAAAKSALKKKKPAKASRKKATDAQKNLRLQVSLTIVTVAMIIVLLFMATAAWFTNVTKTQELSFKTQSFGFDEEKILVDETEIALYPGTEGIVPLTVDNSDGVTAVKAGVNIDKSDLYEELQKRIFFYRDESSQVTYEDEDGNEVTETASKTYIGSSDAGTSWYTINAGMQLVLSETYYNDVPVKWYWVSNMVGYYFLGTVVSGSSVNADEYIRPIEYDPDEGVYDSSGYLTAVGDTALEEFLYELSSADGYEGTIDTDDAVVSADGGIYYPVSVDSEGYGIWAYLCTLEEIEVAAAYDSVLDGVTAQISVSVTIVSQSAVSVSVSSEEELLEEIASGEADIIEISGNMDITAMVDIEEGTDAVIDLNGYTLTYTGEEDNYQLFNVYDGASLTLMNGSLTGNGLGSSSAASSLTFGVYLMGGDAVLSNLTISGFDTAVHVDDWISGLECDSSVVITGCTLTSVCSTVVVYGNGELTDALTRVVINESTITSTEYVGIMGQGSNSETAQYWGTEIVVRNSTVTGYWAGVYQPQQSSAMLITGSVISGYTGISVKGGTVDIYSSTVSGTGTVHYEPPASSGFQDTGDAVTVEATYGWAAGAYIRGDENVLTSDYGYAAELYGTDGKGPGTLVIEGGSLEGALGSYYWNETGNLSVSGLDEEEE